MLDFSTKRCCNVECTYRSISYQLDYNMYAYKSPYKNNRSVLLVNQQSAPPPKDERWLWLAKLFVSPERLKMAQLSSWPPPPEVSTCIQFGGPKNPCYNSCSGRVSDNLLFVIIVSWLESELFNQLCLAARKPLQQSIFCES